MKMAISCIRISGGSISAISGLFTDQTSLFELRMPMAIFRLLSTCAPSPVVSCVASQSAQSLSGCVIAQQFCNLIFFPYFHSFPDNAAFSYMTRAPQKHCALALTSVSTFFLLSFPVPVPVCLPRMTNNGWYIAVAVLPRPSPFVCSCRKSVANTLNAELRMPGMKSDGIELWELPINTDRCCL